MKFLAIALAAILGLVDAKQHLTSKAIQQRLKSGKFDKKALMAKARPYGRQLDQNGDDAFEPTADYSVSFESCVSLKVQDDNLLDENYVDYAEEGSLVSERSYIIFSMCYDEDCYYEADDAYNTYIVDVGTFVMSMANYLPTQRENFCQQCERNQDYCSGAYDANDDAAANDDGAAQDEEQGDEENDNEEENNDNEENNEEEGEENEEDNEEEGDEGEGGRRLAQVQYIDCDLCDEYECFEEEGDDAYAAENIDYNAAQEWIEGLAECMQTENQQNNMNLYAGFMCNAYNSGVEIGLFLDEECTLYTTSYSFANLMSEDDALYYEKATELIQHMFTTDVSCKEDNTEYTNPYDNEGANQDDDQVEEDQVGEWCQNLFQEGAQNLYDCQANDDEEEEADDDSWGNVDWYEYDISGNDVEDDGKACYVVQQFEGEYGSHIVYNQESSGSLFDYSKASEKSTGGSKAGAAVVAIIILIVLAAVGAAWAFRGNQRSKPDKKRTPLINGSMA